MRKDYHMHPTVLSAPERFDSFVQSALDKNIGEICITDHMPLSKSTATDRIARGKIVEYCKRVRELAGRYEGMIGIKCGIEIDYHPSVISEIEEVLDVGDFDYILASSHMHIFIKDCPNYTFNDFAKVAIENSIEAVETGWFSAVSHFDMYHFAFENPHRFHLVNDGYDVYRHETLIKEFLDAVVKSNMYLEINAHFAEEKGDISRTYPQEPITSWALNRGVRFSYGSDAHRARSVGALLEELEIHSVYGRALRSWEEEK